MKKIKITFMIFAIIIILLLTGCNQKKEIKKDIITYSTDKNTAIINVDSMNISTLANTINDLMNKHFKYIEKINKNDNTFLIFV